MDHSYTAPGPSKEKTKRVKANCCVPQCSNYYKPGLSLHQFPSKEDLKKKWEVALRMGKPASTGLRVCSEHFLPSDYFPTSGKRPTLFPAAVPSQKLPVRTHDSVETSPVKRRREARSQRASTREQNKRNFNEQLDQEESEPSLSGEESLPPGDEGDVIYKFDKSTQVHLSDDRVFVTDEEQPSIAEMLCEGSLEKTTHVHFRDVRQSDCPGGASSSAVLNPSSNLAKSLDLPDILSSDSKLFTFTGIHSLDLLNTVVDCLGDLEVDSTTKKKSMSLKDRVILTMVKIKINLSFTAIGALFGITRQTACKNFKNMCPMLSKVLNAVIPWPDEELIRSYLPLSFGNFKKTRVVLDCAETVIEKCHCLKCRVLTYSQYKGNHTVKYLVGVAPSGLITFISPAYGGRASDKHITNESGILEKLDFYDAVMTDKGFMIEKECDERLVTLIRPPFLRQKKQLSRKDALETAEIARARVHVERVIQRMREFDFPRGPIPWTLAPYVDDVLIIVAGLTNLGPPIMNVDKCM